MVPSAVTLLKRAAGQPHLPLTPMGALSWPATHRPALGILCTWNTLWLEWEWPQAPSSCPVGGCLVRGRSPEISWVPPGGPSSPQQCLLHPRPSGERHCEEGHLPDDTEPAAVPGCPEPASGAAGEAPLTGHGQRARPQGQASSCSEGYPGRVL